MRIPRRLRIDHRERRRSSTSCASASSATGRSRSASSCRPRSITRVTATTARSRARRDAAAIMSRAPRSIRSSARWWRSRFVEFWDVMSRPPRFDARRAGRRAPALLARDILRSAAARDPAFAAALRYRIVETEPRARDGADAATLDDARTRRAPSVARRAAGRRSTGCVLSNELVDAFPVHRVVPQGGDAAGGLRRRSTATAASSTSSGPLSDARAARATSTISACFRAKAATPR